MDVSDWLSAKACIEDLKAPNCWQRCCSHDIIYRNVQNIFVIIIFSKTWHRSSKLKYIWHHKKVCELGHFVQYIHDQADTKFVTFSEYISLLNATTSVNLNKNMQDGDIVKCRFEG